MTRPQNTTPLQEKWLANVVSGRTSLIIYTLIECCRRRRQYPGVSLRDVLPCLPNRTNRQIQDVTPAVWSKSQKQKQTAA